MASSINNFSNEYFKFIWTRYSRYGYRTVKILSVTKLRIQEMFDCRLEPGTTTRLPSAPESPLARLSATHDSAWLTVTASPPPSNRQSSPPPAGPPRCTRDVNLTACGLAKEIYITWVVSVELKIMGRIKAKGKKLAVTNQDDPGSAEEEKTHVQKRRGRPQNYLMMTESEDTTNDVHYIEFVFGLAGVCHW
ncbi:unnamed protein product [Fraxinus pennsylvanica]|uniref:Uncharacterized protein n=1 Tax=Fraxinus pennsylvanica TaxID=56036 RepID=A0AAD2A647_9LAMI|nr:unnamed protein product [Fraxinus pennsylvanica]